MDPGRAHRDRLFKNLCASRWTNSRKILTEGGWVGVRSRREIFVKKRKKRPENVARATEYHMQETLACQDTRIPMTWHQSLWDLKNSVQQEGRWGKCPGGNMHICLQSWLPLELISLVGSWPLRYSHSTVITFYQNDLKNFTTFLD